MRKTIQEIIGLDQAAENIEGRQSTIFVIPSIARSFLVQTRNDINAACGSTLNAVCPGSDVTTPR